MHDATKLEDMVKQLVAEAQPKLQPGHTLTAVWLDAEGHEHPTLADILRLGLAPGGVKARHWRPDDSGGFTMLAQVSLADLRCRYYSRLDYLIDTMIWLARPEIIAAAKQHLNAELKYS